MPLLVRGISVEHDTTSLLGTAATPLLEAVQASKSHDSAVSAFAHSDDLTEEDEYLINSPLRLGTYIVEFSDFNARSTARSAREHDLLQHYRWIDHALDITLCAFAALIFQSLLPSLE